MRRNTMLILAGAAALAVAGVTGCEREVAREETVVERDGEVVERHEERVIDERNGVRREEVQETAPPPPAN
jgi:hypothetical protein